MIPKAPAAGGRLAALYLAGSRREQNGAFRATTTIPMRLPAPPAPWLLKPLHALQLRRYGHVLQPTALWSWRPRAFLWFLGLFRAVRRKDAPVPLALRTLAAVRVAQMNRCDFCIDLNTSLLLEAGGVSRDKALAIGRWREGGVFDAAEALVLEYAEAMTVTPPAVDDALFARMREAFGPEAIVELTAGIALQNLSARFNAALGAEAEGFCALPAPAGRG